MSGFNTINSFYWSSCLFKTRPAGNKNSIHSLLKIISLVGLNLCCFRDVQLLYHWQIQNKRCDLSVLNCHSILVFLDWLKRTDELLLFLSIKGWTESQVTMHHSGDNIPIAQMQNKDHVFICKESHFGSIMPSCCRYPTSFAIVSKRKSSTCLYITSQNSYFGAIYTPSKFSWARSLLLIVV